MSQKIGVYVLRLGILFRVCVGRKFSYDWGGMCNLAFIAATILIIGLLWSESAQNSKLWLQ